MPVEDRLRSLTDINHLFRAVTTLDGAISELLAARPHVDVLEVGFGYGRVLLELAWQFSDAAATFYGVDLGRKAPIKVKEREDLRNVADQFHIIPASHLACFNLPMVYFYDATTLHFPEESMDFVFSAVTIRFMEHKAKFLEEVCRVLRPGGRAILHIGESHWNYPYSRAVDNRVLTPYTSRFVLKYGDELIPLPMYLQLWEGNRFRFAFTTASRCILTVSKLLSGQLDLQLEYDPDLSIKGRDLPLRNKKGDIRGGFRSVYNVQSAIYRALFAKGILSKEQLHMSEAL